MPRVLSPFWKRKLYWQRKYVFPVVFIMLFAVVGSVLLLGSKAAGPYASIQPEGGTLSGATSVSDSNASNGSYVQFGTDGSGATGCTSGSQPYDPNDNGDISGSSWTRVFCDGFSGTTLNTANWAPDWYGNGTQAPGYGFNTDASEVSVNNGLSLNSNGNSGSLISSISNGGANPGFMFNYDGNSAVSGSFNEAYLEIYWGVPVDSGSVNNQVTFWYTPVNWGSSGSLEIDVAEGTGCLNMNLHYGSANTKNDAASTCFTGQNGTVWCHFGLLLTASSFSRFFNGGDEVTVTNGEYGTGMDSPTQQQGIVINNGSGNDTLPVAYVAVWQR